MRRLRLALAAAVTAALVAGAPVGAATRTQSDSTAAQASVATAYALVQLKGAPLATEARTRPAPGKKVDFSSATVKSYRAHLSAVRNDFKAWLKKNAPKAQVVKGYDLSLNAVSIRLNGTSLAKIRTSALVARAELQGVYTRTADPDLDIISATEGWALAGASIGAAAEAAGEGVKVGVIDSGIDVDHPCFDDQGYVQHLQLGDRRYTNNKVIVARVFNNKGNQNGFDAKAVDSHGTHVAGTVACNHDTAATVEGAAIPHGISGVAPRALLGNYNVFPGTVDNARSEDILNAIETAYTDGMDIVNMSLGGGANGVQDLLTVAVDNLDRAGMVFAISAGNEGPGHSTVGSPGSASRAITAGASTVNHAVVSPITAGAASAAGVPGDFGTPSAYPFTGTLRALPGTGVAGIELACAPLAPAASADSIALVARGVCDFSLKVYNVQQAGYRAALVVNRIGGAPIAMGKGAAPGDPTIPAWMIGMDAADAFRAADGNAVAVAAPTYTYPFYDVDVMADFSSQGPTDVDDRIKPDVVAPGVNVLSSIPTSDCGGEPCFAFFGGTSMASPHLAGAAAVIKWQHPTWPAWAIRSAIVNTADTDVLTRYTLDGAATDVNLSGAGRVNVESAAGATALLSQPSMSFGATPKGSGVTKSVAVTLLNAGASEVEWTIGIAANGGAQGVTFGTSTSLVHLAPGATVTFTVTAAFAKAAGAGDKQAWLVIRAGGELVAHAAVYARVK